MDNDIRQKSIEELTKYLNRAPTETEIMNSQTDINIMTKVKDRQQKEKEALLATEIDFLKSKIK